MNVDTCTKICKNSLVKVQEGCRSAVIVNSARLEYKVIQVDKCLAIDGPKADFVIERNGRAIIIELKGRGVEHGATQAVATSELWLKGLKRVSVVSALIVGVMAPRARPSMLVRQSEYRRRFGTPLHVIRQNGQFEFDNIFSFRGPLKA